MRIPIWLRRASRLGLTFTLVALSAAVTVSAQNPQGMVPFNPADRETLPAAPLVYGAYAFVWAALIAYVFAIWRRLGRVERELAEVNTRLGAARKS